MLQLVKVLSNLVEQKKKLIAEERLSIESKMAAVKRKLNI